MLLLDCSRFVVDLYGVLLETLHKVRKRDGIDEGCYFVIKVQFPELYVSQQFNMLENELRFEKNSPFLQRPYYVFKDNEAACLVTEIQSSFKDIYMAMYSNQQRFTEYPTKFYAAEMLLVIEEMHSKGIAHTYIFFQKSPLR